MIPGYVLVFQVVLRKPRASGDDPARSVLKKQGVP